MKITLFAVLALLASSLRSLSLDRPNGGPANVYEYLLNFWHWDGMLLLLMTGILLFLGFFATMHVVDRCLVARKKRTKHDCVCGTDGAGLSE
jgi:hypothetical protein